MLCLVDQGLATHPAAWRAPGTAVATGRRTRRGQGIMETSYEIEDVPGGVPVKMWTRGVPVEDEARKQLANAARLPVVFRHIAAMPDVHLGIGATVGSVIPTL